MAWKNIEAKFITDLFPLVNYAISIPVIQRNGISFLKRDTKHLSLDEIQNQTTNMIIGVQDPTTWHAQNLLQNPSHYSLSARATKTKLISFFSRRGARVHRNVFQAINDNRYQYWVIGMDDLKEDLKCWETLAVSSFMHLPVLLTHIVDR